MIASTDTLTPARIEWRDGKPFNLDSGDWYSSTAGALAESEYVFIGGNRLDDRWDSAPRIGELGFGTGLNFLACVRQWLATPRSGWLHYTAVERAPLTPADHRRALEPWPALDALARELLSQMPEPQRGFHLLVFPNWKVRLLLLLDEATTALAGLDGTVDAWFLDGFAPARNPDMWSAPLWREIRRLSTAGTTFATYSAAGHVRRGLAAAGFEVSKRPGFGHKRDMLNGRMPVNSSRSALPAWFARPTAAGPQAVTVVGAGLTGCAIAHCLAEAGCQVTLLDAQPAPARGASAMPAMLVRPYPERKPSARERLYARAAAFARRRLKGRPGLEPTTIDLADGQSTQGAVVEPAQLCASWLEHSRIAWQPGTEVRGLERGGEGWRLHTDTGMLTAEAVVLATADAAELTDAIPATRAVRGQLGCWQDLEPPPRPRCDHGHVIPWRGGLVAGATYRRGDTDCRPRADDAAEIAQLVERLLPGTHPDPARAQAHVGVRRTTPDRLPMIGPVPEAAAWRQTYADLHHGSSHADWPAGAVQDGLWCSLGHGSRGATLAALQAELLAAWMLGWPSPLPVELLTEIHPGRFLIRELRRGRPAAKADNGLP